MFEKKKNTSKRNLSTLKNISIVFKRTSYHQEEIIRPRKAWVSTMFLKMLDYKSMKAGRVYLGKKCQGGEHYGLPREHR